MENSVAEQKLFSMEIRANGGWNAYMQVVQRETANLLMNTSLDEFDRAYYAVKSWERSVAKNDKERLQAEMTILCKKYPDLHDFSLIGTRAFIPYSSDSYRITTIAEHFIDQSKYMILTRLLDGRESTLFDEEDTKWFERTKRGIIDKRFRAEIDEAMKRFYIKRPELDFDFKVYEDQLYRVESLTGVEGRAFTPDVEFGIPMKKTDEYAIYSFFVDDEKTYYNSYRSNASFTEHSVLDTF